MKKKIRLTESQLTSLIKKTVNKVLKENDLSPMNEKNKGETEQIIQLFNSNKEEILKQIDTTFTNELLNNEMGGLENVTLEFNDNYGVFEINYKYGGSDIFISDNPNLLKQFENINDIDVINLDGIKMYIVTTR